MTNKLKFILWLSITIIFSFFCMLIFSIEGFDKIYITNALWGIMIVYFIDVKIKKKELNDRIDADKYTDYN